MCSGGAEIELGEDNSVHLARSFLGYSLRQAVSLSRYDICGRGSVRYVETDEINIRNFGTVHRLKRHAATVDILYEAIRKACVFEAIVCVRSELDSGGEGADHHIADIYIATADSIRALEAESVVACHNVAVVY